MYSPTNFHIAILDGKPETIKSRKRREWANARHSLSPLRILDLQLFLGAQNHSKPRIAAHHALVGFGGALQGKHFVHRSHTALDAESERVFRIDRGSGIPTLNRPTS